MTGFCLWGYYRGGADKVLYSVGSNVSAVDNNGKVTPPAVVKAAIDAAAAVANKADAIILGLGLCGDNYGGTFHDLHLKTVFTHNLD